MRPALSAALGLLVAFAVTACQPSSDTIEKVAQQQEEILAKLKTLEANQKKILAARQVAARPQPPKEDPDKIYEIDLSGSPVFGNPDAPVAVVEYSDFQCPFCAQATPLLKAMQEDYGDKVKLVFKHFPLSFHKTAMPAAIASMAAKEQGKFWEMHDVLFKNQRTLDPNKMADYAAEAGLDVERFKRDLFVNRAQYRKRVEADFAEGQRVTVRGTPTIFIGGKKVQNRSVAGMAALVEEALKKNGQGG